MNAQLLATALAILFGGVVLLALFFLMQGELFWLGVLGLLILVVLGVVATRNA